MNCKKAIKKFLAALNNEIDTEQFYEFQSHLNNCTKCRNIYNEISKTYNVDINNIESKDPYFFSKIMTKIENQQIPANVNIIKKAKPALITLWFIITFISGIFLGSNFMNSINSNNYSSIVETQKKENILNIFNLSEIDEESPEYLLMMN